MDDDFAHLLLGEQGNPNALLLQILGDAYEDWDLIVAIEGPSDRCFYFDFVSELLEEEKPQFFECGGKGRLVKFREVFEQYNWKNKPRIHYLCDKDFDDYLGFNHPQIFKTSHYSIESYFIDEAFVGYVIDKYCHRALTPQEKDRFLQDYRKRFISTLPTLRVVCAAMCEIRGRGEHPNFDDLGIDKIFEFGRDSIKRRGSIIAKIRQILKLKSMPCHLEIIGRSKSFTPENYQRWMRGKLGLQVTKKVFEQSRSNMPEAIKTKLPSPNYFGSDAFRDAHAFLKELPGLKEYLAVGS